MSRLQQGLKTRQTRFALALKVALLGGVVAFSSAVFAEGLLKEGITPATDASQIPASAKLRKDTVVAGISEPQGIFNPYFFVNGWDENVTNVIFSRLIDWDSQGKLVPGLAESWTVSPDNKVYTIKLRPGLTFSDGSPLTAEDVAFTLTVLLDPKYDGDTDITLANIAGGTDYKAGKADSVSGLKVIDPLTLQGDHHAARRHHAGQNWRACTVESLVRQRVSAGKSRLSALTARQAAGQRPLRVRQIHSRSGNSLPCQ